MRVHPVTFRVAHGIAGSGVFVDTTQIQEGDGKNGMPDWWGDRVIYCGSGQVRSCLSDGTDDRLEDGRQCNLVRACPAGWAAFQMGGPDGVFTSWGLSLPLAVLLDMSWDGTLLVGDGYQTGVGLSAYAVGTQEKLWTVPDARPMLWYPYSEAVLLDAQRCAWVDGDGLVLRSRGLGDTPVIPWKIYHPTLLELDGHVWLCMGRQNDSMVAVPWGFTGDGLYVAHGGYGPCGTAQDGQVAMRWSLTAAEGLYDIQMTLFDPSAEGPIPPLSTTPPVEPPVPPVEPPEIPMPETPNRSDVVQSVFNHGHYDLTTVEGCCIFTQNCAFALHNEDPRWGLLKKNPGQHQCASGTAVDNVLYLHDDPALSVAVDIIHASASPDAAPSWSPDTPRYTVADWLAPDALPVPTAALPRPWVCHSGFDLSQWTPSEMDAWLSVFKSAGYNAIRIVPASKFRGPTGEGRTLEEGIIALPAALEACRRAGLWAEVSILVDTGRDYYNMDRAQMSFYVQDVWAVCELFRDVVKMAELANENYHGTQNPALMDTAFLRQLRLHIPLDVPVSWGSTHSEPDGQVIVGGDYITVHSDRGTPPDWNGQAMADLQARFGRPVIDDEPLGMAEEYIAGKRTNDPNYATELGHAIVDHELGGGTFHCEAGMYADLSKLGPIQRDGLERYTAARGVSPVPPIPPIPPPSGHPILDHPLVPVERGYRFWVANRVDITIAAHDWYVRAHGWQPAESDISHGLWRGMNEGERWGTLRQAWEETWPGGAPK
jgi:hypothetical protein